MGKGRGVGPAIMIVVMIVLSVLLGMASIGVIVSGALFRVSSSCHDHSIPGNIIGANNFNFYIAMGAIVFILSIFGCVTGCVRNHWVLIGCGAVCLVMFLMQLIFGAVLCQKDEIKLMTSLAPTLATMYSTSDPSIHVIHRCYGCNNAMNCLHSISLWLRRCYRIVAYFMLGMGGAEAIVGSLALGAGFMLRKERNIIGIGFLAIGALCRLALRELAKVVPASLVGTVIFNCVLAFGLIIFVVAIFGCFICYKKSQCLFFTLGGCLSVAFIIVFSFGIASLIKSKNKDQLRDDLGAELYKLIEEKSDSMSAIEEAFKCCGAWGPSDYVQHGKPFTCGSDVGCAEKISIYMSQSLWFVAVVMLSVSGLEGLGAAFAIVIGCLIRINVSFSKNWTNTKTISKIKSGPHRQSKILSNKQNEDDYD